MPGPSSGRLNLADMLRSRRQCYRDLRLESRNRDLVLKMTVRPTNFRLHMIIIKTYFSRPRLHAGICSRSLRQHDFLDLRHPARQLRDYVWLPCLHARENKRDGGAFSLGFAWIGKERRMLHWDRTTGYRWRWLAIVVVLVISGDVEC